MPSVGTAYVNIRVSTKGFETSLDSLMKRLSTKMEKAGTNLGKDFERGLNKTNFDSALSKLPAAVDKAATKSAASLDKVSDGFTKIMVDSDDAGNHAANNINKITTEARIAQNETQKLGTSLKDVGRSARGINLSGIGAGGGGGMRKAGDDAGFFSSKMKELVNAAEGGRATLTHLYQTEAFLGTGLAGMVGGLSAAAQGIFAIGANAASAAPAVAILANGLMSLGQVGAVAAIASKGVGAALKAGFTAVQKSATAASGPTKSLAASTKRAADTARRAVEAARRGVRDAVRGVQDAQRAVADAARGVQDAMRGVADAKQGLKDAYADAARSAADASRRTLDAEQALAAAQRGTTAAQVALNAARKEGLEQLEDIAFAAEDAGMAEERASLALQDAYRKLQAVSELPPDNRSRVEAELAYREAELNMRQATDRREDADKAQQEAAKNGVEGTDAVRSASEDLANARKDEAGAARDVADARREEAQTAEDNARRIQDAQDGVADSLRGVADAQRGVADAQRNLADAHQRLADAQQKLRDELKQQKDGLDKIPAAAAAAATAVDNFKAAMAKLGPEQRKFVNTILGMRDEFQKFRNAIAEPLFERLNTALENFVNGGLLDVLQTGLEGTAAALGDTAIKASELSGDPIFKKSFGDAMSYNNEAIGHFGGAAVDLADAFVQVADAAGPLFVKFSKWVGSVADGWDKTLRLKNSTGELSDTINTAGDRVSEFWGLAKQLWRTLMILGGAANDAANEFKWFDDEGRARKGYIPSLTESLKDFNNKLDTTQGRESLFDRFTQSLKNLNAAGGAIKTVFQPFIDMGSDPQIATAFDTIAKSDAFDRLGATAGDAVPELADLVVNIADFLAALSESGSIDHFLNIMVKVTDSLVWFTELLAHSGVLKWTGYITAAMASLRLLWTVTKIGVSPFVGLAKGFTGFIGNIKTAKGEVKGFKGMWAGLKGGLKTSLFGGGGAKVAGAGAEAKEGTWESEVLIHLKGIITAIDTCCIKLSAAMGRGAAASGLQGAAGAGGARAPFGAAAAGAAGVSGGVGLAAGEVGKVSKFAGVMGKFSKVLGPASKLMKPLSLGIRGIGMAFRFALGPIGMIVLTVLPLLWPLLVQLEKKTGIFSKTLDVLKKALGKVGDAFKWLWEKIQDLFGWVKKNWPLLLAIITGPIGLAVLAITKNWDKIVNFIKGVPDKIKNALSGMWDVIKEKLVAAWEAVKSYWWKAVEIGDEIERRLKKGLAKIWDFLKDNLVAAWKKVKDYWWKAVEIGDEIERRLKKGLAKIWDVVKDKLRDAWTRVKEIWGNIVTWVKGRPDQFVRNLKALWNIFKDGLNTAFETVKTIWGRVITWAKERPGKLTDALSGLWDGFKDKLNTAWTRVKEIWETIKTTIGRWPGQMSEKLSGIWDGVKNGLRGAYNWAAGKVNDYLIANINKILNKFNAPTITKWDTFAEGGPVRGPGGPRQDRVPALLSNGEYVLPTRSVKKLGQDHLDYMRKHGTLPPMGDPGLFGSLWNRVKDVGGALKKGAEYAIKWALSKLSSQIEGHGLVSQIILGVLGKAASAITGFGKKKDDEASAAAAAKAGGGGADVVIPDPNNPAGRRGYRGKSWFTNRFLAHLQKAERLANTSMLIYQGGFQPQTSYSGTSHRGDAIDIAVSYALLKALRRVGIAAGDRTGLGNWAPHIHAVPGPKAGYGAGSAVWQWTDYVARGGAKQSYTSPWGLAAGGVVGPSPNGVLALLAEAGKPERVTPLDPEGFTPAERRMLEVLESKVGSNGGGDTIHVHPSEKMNEVHLADLVARRVAWKRRRGAGAR
jgi:phage-related protein